VVFETKKKIDEEFGQNSIRILEMVG